VTGSRTSELPSLRMEGLGGLGTTRGRWPVEAGIRPKHCRSKEVVAQSKSVIPVVRRRGARGTVCHWAVGQSIGAGIKAEEGMHAAPGLQESPVECRKRVVVRVRKDWRLLRATQYQNCQH